MGFIGKSRDRIVGLWLQIHQFDAILPKGFDVLKSARMQQIGNQRCHENGLAGSCQSGHPQSNGRTKDRVANLGAHRLQAILQAIADCREDQQFYPNLCFLRNRCFYMAFLVPDCPFQAFNFVLIADYAQICDEN